MSDESAPSPTSDALARLLAARADFLAFLVRRVGDREVAEDLLQDALAKAMERLDDLRDEEAVVAWFYRLLRNAVIDRARRAAAAERRLATYARELEALAAPDADHEREVCRCVGAVAGDLKPEYAEVLTRVELGGAPLQAFAAEAGITANNAGVRLHRARKALARELRVFCGRCAEHGCVDCACRARPS